MTEPGGKPRWREPLGVFALALGAIIALSLLSPLVPLLAQNLVAIVGLVFFALAHLAIRRIGASPADFGIDLDRLPRRQILFGLGVSAIVFPLFALGNHLWERHALERDFHPSLHNLRQWSPSLELRPPELQQDGARVWLQRRTLFVEVAHLTPDTSPPTLIARADHPTHWQTVGSGSLRPTDDDRHTWELTPTAPLSRFSLPPLDPHARPQTLTSIELSLNGAPITSALQNVDAGQPLRLKRGLSWLLLWALTHLLLVALPEEVFYRGYLQTRLAQRLRDEHDQPRQFLGLSLANWLTSALFALGHLLVPVGGAIIASRAAVFFPSLIFGWMRERSGSIIAPTIFHACANMMVLIVSVHYF
ncbi:CPBP family intramembrane metalloprotease [Lujinxingia vulgaris]|uniref:CPBP family intramembrane metalloprotease n=1 Tax=Lujinxingia vulgaris TaxID=2600176 RepID=A0A5C6XNG3_9DELT|nr:MrtP family glutamic-type intramembrane protease [Lujinxingia vulgaris]TXD38939.1 CPBP family intramembrane metalloprotease [Lujinxingia vulgaris]